MSGVEVAGIILAVIPLIVAGFESYDDTKSKLRFIKRYQQELRSINRVLRAENQIFRNTIQVLLRSCLDDGTVASLLQHVGGPRWADPAVEIALKRRLGDSYRVRVETIDDVRRNVYLLCDYLGVDKTTSARAPTTMQQVSTKISFAFRKTSYLEIVADISKSNVQLEKLVHHIPAFLLPAHSAHGRKARDEVRDHATALFLAMQRALCKSCKTLHAASLHIDARPGRSKHASMEYRIVLHHLHHLHHLHQTDPRFTITGMTWSAEEAEIRLLASGALGTATSAQLNSKGGDGQRLEPSRTDDTIVTGASSAIPAAARSTMATLDNAQSQLVISDLCGSMQRLQQMQSGVCLGYLMDAAGKPCHDLYWSRKRIVDERPAVSRTLMNILSEKRTRRSPLTIRESRQLAMHIAAGALQFANTPWLGNQWSKRDITLFESNGRVLADHPFITASLQNRAAALTSCDGSVLERLVRNRTLFWLGVLLIELCMGEPIEELQTAKEAASGGQDLERCYVVADRLLTEGLIFDTAGDRYDKAVRRCIYCLFESRSTDLRDPDFHRTVEIGVLDLLRQDVEVLFPAAENADGLDC